MTTRGIKAMKVLSIIATVMSQCMSTNCKNDMWTEITNICDLECHKFEIVGWH